MNVNPEDPSEKYKMKFKLGPIEIGLFWIANLMWIVVAILALIGFIKVLISG